MAANYNISLRSSGASCHVLCTNDMFLRSFSAASRRKKSNIAMLGSTAKMCSTLGARARLNRPVPAPTSNTLVWGSHFFAQSEIKRIAANSIPGRTMKPTRPAFPEISTRTARRAYAASICCARASSISFQR